MRKEIKLFIGGLITLAILGLIFFLPPRKEDDMKKTTGEKTITKQDDGKEIKVNPCDEIVLELEGVGATGYWWYPESLDSEHLELVSEETRQASADNKEIAGSPVLGIWRFRTKSPGLSEIRMAYYRSWEGKENAIDHFLVKISIN